MLFRKTLACDFYMPTIRIFGFVPFTVQGLTVDFVRTWGYLELTHTPLSTADLVLHPLLGRVPV